MSSHTYDLEPLSASDARQWDGLTATYPTRTLFHRRAWLDYLAASQDAEIRLWRIMEDGATRGYFAGGLVRKGPFRILGSPLRGWGTNFLGPVADSSLISLQFLAALDRLAMRERLSMIELESLSLEPGALVTSRYEPETTATFVVEISSGDTDRMWRRLDPKRRAGIRRAEESGLKVEDAQDMAIADEYYDQFMQVMRRKGLVPPYSRERTKLLVRHLMGAGLLLALRIRDENGYVVSTGLFPHDDTTMYFWGGASSADAYKTFANEYMQWGAMRLAADIGLTSYNMCGNGLFKKKFGGELHQVRRWSRYYTRTARWGRKAYGLLFAQGLRVRSALQRTFA